MEPKPSCLCCSWLEPVYIQSMTALFPQGSVPFESNFSHVVLFKSSHSKFQPTYANLLSSNITHDSKIMINQQNLRNTFSILFSSKQTAYLLLEAKTKISCFTASVQTNNTLSKSIRTVNIFNNSNNKFILYSDNTHNVQHRLK